MKLFSIFILSVFLVQEPIEPKLELENFVFQEQELPNGCKLKPVASNDRLPCAATSNPFISSERSFLDCFTRQFVRDSALIQSVKRGLFSVYEDQSEIGIYGLETDSEETTRLILNHIETNYPNDESGEFIQSGKMLIWLWHDKGKPNSFDDLKKLIEAQIK